MQTKSTILTREERDVLLLVGPHGKHLNNTEIAQRLDVSVSKVKTLIHQACVKLGAHNRIEAVFFAMRRGEISLNEFYSHDELAEILSPLGIDTLIRIAHLIRQQLEHGYLPRKDEQIILTDRRKGGILTNRERDVLVLAGRGLTNIEIADRLYMSIGSVRVFLNRANIKLGAHNRYEANVMALIYREIGLGEIFSLNEIVQLLAPLGAESIEKMAQQQNPKLGQEYIPTGS